MRFIIRWIVTTLAIIVATNVVPGVESTGEISGPIFCALTLAFVNAFVRPVLKLLSLPINILTLGLFHFVVNAALLRLAASMALILFGEGLIFHGFWPAIFAAVVVSIMSSIISKVVPA